MLQYPQRDELAELFQRNLHLAGHGLQTPDGSTQNPVQEPGRITYASQHYTQSAHLRQNPVTESIDDGTASQASSLEATLRRHDIDPSTLFPSQIRLYESVSSSQRLQLLEMWRTAPQEYGTPDYYNQLHSAATSMAQEEYMAKRRFERTQQRSQQNSQVEARPPSSETEPYMRTGYMESRSDRPSLDPVYAAATGLWQAPTYSQAVEDQYGAFEQARTFERLQGLHLEVEADTMTRSGVSGDEDMIM